MTTETYKKLAQTGLLAAGGVIYTCPAATSVIIKAIHVVNVAGAQQSPKLWQGGNANANLILPPVAMQTGEYANYDGVITMAAGDTIQGQCDTDNGVTITIEGVELT